MSAAIPTQRRRGSASDTWPRVRLGEVCNINMGQSPESSTYNSSSEGLPFYQGNADFGIIHPKPRVWCSAPVKIAKAGDLLISVRAPIGALNFANERCCIGRGLAALSALPNVEYGFLYYALKSKVAELNAKGTGSTFKAINKRALSAISIVLPPLAIQRRIAAKLDLLCDIVSKRKNQLSQLNQLVKSRFVEMFGDVHDSVAIGQACVVMNGYAFKSAQYVSDGIRVIRITNVQQGYMEDPNPEFYPREKEGEIQKYMLQENDLLISLTGNVGRVALLPKEFLPAGLNQRVGCLRIRSGINLLKSYLYWALNNQTFECACIESSRGVAQKNMSSEWLKQYLIPIPPLALQREFAAFVEKVDKLAAAVKRGLEAAERLYRQQMQELFGETATKTTKTTETTKTTKTANAGGFSLSGLSTPSQGLNSPVGHRAKGGNANG